MAHHPGNGEDLPALLQSQARGDQRATAVRSLDHHHAEGQPADDPVAHGKMPRNGGRPQGEFRKDGA